MRQSRPPKPAPTHPPTLSNRRRFLQVVSVSPLVLDCAGPSDVGPQSIGKVSAGRANAKTVERTLGRQPLCIGRDQAGVYAMTLTCPHAGCDMSRNGWVSSEAVFCSCHGSKFDPYGRVTQGPARSNLQHFEVTIDEAGNLMVDTDSWVDPSTRLVV